MNRRCRSVQRYSVGARWVARADNGATAEVFLQKGGSVEMWIGQATTPGAGGVRFGDRDWFPSRRGAADFAKAALSALTKQRPLPRLRRVEDKAETSE